MVALNTSSTLMMMTAMLIVCSSFATTSAFQTISSPTTLRRSSLLNMAAKAKGGGPRFDKTTEKWIVTDPATQGPEAGYDLIGSLYRAGPVPFIQRVINAEQYEQAVLKYMAAEGCDRKEAQGNMDAYFENPQDWAYQKMQEQNGAAKKDYANANMDPKQIALSTIWAGVVFWFAYYLVTGLAEGKWGKAEGTDLLHGNLWTLPF
mmetsp:Transcript_35414/g.72380  ORF Transcript_35414/g.72380 Transcript_35414/m.72380 type:complete len:205 (-) Transcript_35414:1112-1726(-)